MSGMKKVARSRGARLAASLDTGTVLRDLLQTVAPVTPTGMALSFRNHHLRPHTICYRPCLRGVYSMCILLCIAAP